LTLRVFVALLILALCAGGITAAFFLDVEVAKEVRLAQGRDWQSDPMKQFHSEVRKWGDWPWLMVAGGVGLGCARLAKSRRWTRLLVAAMLASTLAGITVNVSRLTTGRTRPRASPEIAQGFYGPWHDGKLLVGNSKYNAFPSGHTATAFGFAWPLLYGCPPAGVAAMGVAALIGWSSIMLGAHHLSDVVVSIMVSAGVGWVVWQWTGRSGEATWDRLRQILKKAKKKD